MLVHEGERMRPSRFFRTLVFQHVAAAQDQKADGAHSRTDPPSRHAQDS